MTGRLGRRISPLGTLPWDVCTRAALQCLPKALGSCCGTLRRGCVCHIESESVSRSVISWVTKKVQNVQFLPTPWIIACQAPLSMETSRLEYGSGLPCPPPGDLPNPGVKPGSPALQADSRPAELPPSNQKFGSNSLAHREMPFKTKVFLNGDCLRCTLRIWVPGAPETELSCVTLHLLFLLVGS